MLRRFFEIANAARSVPGHRARTYVRPWDVSCLTSNIHTMPEAHYSTVAATERSALAARRIPDARAETDRVPIDLAAFEALYESHGARMKSLALNALGNRSDAE